MQDNETPQTKPRKEAYVDEAYNVIEAGGLESLSLREVARRLKVSHQAPYKHFASRDHILAAVVARCFSEFARYLNDRPMHEEPWADLGEMGQAYLRFAQSHPLKYRLMFNTPLPEPDAHPEMMRHANATFDLLATCLDRTMPNSAAAVIEDQVRHDAIFVWSVLHGFSSILESDLLPGLDLDEGGQRSAQRNIFNRIGRALGET